MPTTERHCRTCGQRCRRGWLRVHEQGDIQAPITARPVTGQAEAVYCSERCLRTQLLGEDGGAKLIVDLQRQVDRLRQALRNRDEARDEAHRPTRALVDLLQSVADQAAAIEDIDLAKVTPGSDEAQQLRITTANLQRLLRPYLHETRSR